MKQNNMQIPEGYKNSSLGIIPNDWEVKRLGEVCESISSGKNKMKSEIGLFPVYGSTGIIGYCKSYIYESPVILVARVGANAGQINIANGKYDVSDNTLIIKNKSTYYLDFAYNQLVNYKLNKLVFGSGQPLITAGQLKSISIILPPLPQQQKIAEILGTWDEAIEKQSKLIDKLTDRKRGLMQQLLTGKKRLAGFSEEWKEVRLGEICDKISNGITYNTDLAEGYPVTRIETISKGVIDYAKIGFAQEVNNMESYKLQKGDILFSHINSLAHIGKVAIYKGENPLYHGMNLLLLRTSIKANDYYLFYFLCSSAARNKIQSLAKQAVNQASVNIEELKKWFILLPSLPEQIAIANILTAADKEIELAKSKLELLRSQKSGLMQELLTGKTRVKID